MVITVESSAFQGSHHVTTSKLAFSSAESGVLLVPEEANGSGLQDPMLAALSVKWRPPDPGLVKVNSDAAIDSSSCLVGFGLVVRDQLGHVLGSSW
ncbi:hypothetical protein ACOSP7_004089 [Xanthoceras sorbifolium]